MVQTRSKKTNVSECVEVVASDVVTYDCNLLIRIHKDAVIEIGKNAHKIPSINNDFNVHLKLLSEGDLNENSPIDFETHDQAPTKSCEIQAYEPAARLTPANVDVAWMQCKHIRDYNNQQINENDVVLAKIRGHSAWPAIVLKLLPKKRAKVEFFGAEPHEKFGILSLNEIVLFKNSIGVLLIQLRKKIHKYIRAVREAEGACGIPHSSSVLNMYDKPLSEN